MKTGKWSDGDQWVKETAGASEVSSSSTHSKPFSVFLDDFGSFLPFAATTLHEFITGDFNIHLNNPADTLTSQFLSILSSFNISQHVDTTSLRTTAYPTLLFSFSVFYFLVVVSAR